MSDPSAPLPPRPASALALAKAGEIAEVHTGAVLGLEPGGSLSAGSLSAGMAIIRRFWETLPSTPGVYRMLNPAGDVLYVGKALNLKARVASYARGDAPNNRIGQMISQTAAMEFITTHTESEALLLEINLIKQLQPRYNVLLRDDKSFPYILITADHEAPIALKHRGAKNRKGFYFGPFASGQAVQRTLNTLQRAFLLRNCPDSVYEGRTRPCLQFQIKRCAGPCTREVSLEEYAQLVREARAFLGGKSAKVRAYLSAEMSAAAERLDYEAAARFRDRLAGLAALQSSQTINPSDIEEADVFAIHGEGGHFCIEVFFFRNGQNWGNRAFFPKADKALDFPEVLDGFLGQFYEDRPAPALVLLSHETENAALLAQALGEKQGAKVQILVPKRGDKADLVAHALANAREALGRRLSETASQMRLLEGLGQTFKLAHPPRRIDVFDNSHIMGTHAVGAMIVCGPRGFSKPHYRSFNIQSTDLTPGDDYGMMREVLGRRFARLQREAPRLLAQADGLAQEAAHGQDPDCAAPLSQARPLDERAMGHAETLPQTDTEPLAETLPEWPDLVLIDGGRGQLEAARAVLAELGITDIPLVGVAKGPERDAGFETFYLVNGTSFRLPQRDPTLYFIQRLRDEAHRFAIGTHRAKRKRAFTQNPLDDIPGIGPQRKRALMLHFGTAKGVSRASMDELARVPGLNAASARRIYDFFHEKSGH